MKTTINKLNSLIGSLQKNIDKRTEIFEKRTETWQESKQGKSYDNATAEKCLTAMALERAVNHLESDLKLIKKKKLNNNNNEKTRI